MESVQQQQQQHHNLPRDSRPMDATESGNPSVQEVESVCPENLLQDAGAMRSRTVQTKGLFNFMELPAEIRVQVNKSPSSFDAHAGFRISLIQDPDKL